MEKCLSQAQQQKFELGLNVLLTEKCDWIQGKSIGLITNHTGVDATLTEQLSTPIRGAIVSAFCDFFSRARILGRGPRRYRCQ